MSTVVTKNYCQTDGPMSFCTARLLDEKKNCTYWEENRTGSNCFWHMEDLNHCRDPWAQAGKKRPEAYSAMESDTTPEEDKKKPQTYAWTKFRSGITKNLRRTTP